MLEIPSAHHRRHAKSLETNLRCGIRQDHGVGAHGHGGNGSESKFAIHLGFLFWALGKLRKNE